MPKTNFLPKFSIAIFIDFGVLIMGKIVKKKHYVKISRYFGFTFSNCMESEFAYNCAYNYNNKTTCL